MPLETGTYISDLDAANPVVSDPTGQGDDHLRLIKQLLLATFPNITGAVTATHTEINTAASTVAAHPFPLPTADIADDAITYAKMQNVSATDMLLGRSTSGAGNVEEIACTAAGRALLDDASASAQRTTLGLATVAASGAYSDLSGKPTLGTAAALDVGTGNNNIVQLDGSAKLPAVDGSALTNVPVAYANVTGRDIVQLAQVDVTSAQAAISFTSGINSTYREYLFVLESVQPVTNAVGFFIEVSDDAGSSWKSTSYQCATFIATNAATASIGSVVQIPLSQVNNVGNSSSNGWCGEVRLFSPSSSSLRKRITFVGGYDTSGSVFVSGTGNWDGGNAAITGIRFRFSSGNVADGTVTMYGIR